MPPQETFFCKQPPVFEFKHFNQEIKVSKETQLLPNGLHLRIYHDCSSSTLKYNSALRIFSLRTENNEWVEHVYSTDFEKYLEGYSCGNNTGGFICPIISGIAKTKLDISLIKLFIKRKRSPQLFMSGCN